jgi:lipopolysaccharide/colanic/teichoic acid biosynthesis glycosyltransferase
LSIRNNGSNICRLAPKQITLSRHDILFEDWMALDLKYIKERSFLVDWKIIFKTFGAVLRKQGE